MIHSSDWLDFNLFEDQLVLQKANSRVLRWYISLKWPHNTVVTCSFVNTLNHALLGRGLARRGGCLIPGINKIKDRKENFRIDRL